jgi:UDP-N-acetylglucosamine 4,6-dehydratase (inverting)
MKIKNQNIFISGGTGTFGQNMLSKILNLNPNRVVIFSRDEMKQHFLKKKFTNKNVRFFLGDIRDYDRLNYAMRDIDIVFHAAALKHVDLAEYNPFEVVKTNIIGSQNIISSALERKVKKVIALSTDKASSPINLYGATKLTSDKLFIAANNHSGKQCTKFSVVRYGNVFGSRGSVVTQFLQKDFKTFYITDESMTRFNITIDNAISFVLNCLDHMLGGELFVPKLKSYRLIDLVSALKKIKKFKIKNQGLRPGEKLHEEMISINEAGSIFDFKNFYVIWPNSEYIKISEKEYLSNFKNGKKLKHSFSYNSKDNKEYMSATEIENLIKKTLG